MFLVFMHPRGKEQGQVQFRQNRCGETGPDRPASIILTELATKNLSLVQGDPSPRASVQDDKSADQILLLL